MNIISVDEALCRAGNSHKFQMKMILIMAGFTFYCSFVEKQLLDQDNSRYKYSSIFQIIGCCYCAYVIEYQMSRM